MSDETSIERIGHAGVVSMDPWLSTFIVIAGSGFGLWLLSFVVETLRPVPKTPNALSWASAIPVKYVEVGGSKLRYIKSGSGPAIVLLHTLRTQLDLFEKVVPELSKRFTVYAFDYPGHGYSDIPKARYDAAFLPKPSKAFSRSSTLAISRWWGFRSAASLPSSPRHGRIRVSRASFPSIHTTTQRG
ncbi:MAG: alpha/beta fold hydrolase [Proteobacteria bacterium]|nr:alpha/beta fold hydrolase [Pseudomonadota bacterium]